MKTNRTTIILSVLIFAISVIAQLPTYGQQWLNPKDNNPPTDLFAEVVDENDVNLFWTQPASGGSTYLHWDNGINYTSYGNFLQPVEHDYVTKYDPEHIAAYDGWNITELRFFVTVPMPTITLKIWTGEEFTEIYSQDVPTFNVNTWTEITLDTPITIDASTQLWAGLNIDMPVTGPVMGCSEGPAISGYGDLYRWNGVWYNGGLNWNIQVKVEEPALPTLLHWDNGENLDQFGNFLQPFEMDFASKWDPEHISSYDGWTINKVNFIIANPAATVKLKIWTGTGATEVYSQDVPSFNVNTWTEVILDTPVTIDASTPVWVGLNVDMPFPGAVMASDDGPAIDGFGNMYRFLGTWYSDFDLNWNIRFEVEDPNKRGIDGLLGYNVYRDDVKINDDTWGATSYVDLNMLNGTYDYHVTAVYDEGESDPSNTVEVIVAQPVIAFADSMALVDIYNNCNGPNWSINDLWLEGPVSEWYGVTTTGTRVTRLWLNSRGVTGDIPESIRALTALKDLHLESNSGLNSIPESIGDCQALEELWLGFTSITVVPESLGTLSNLLQLHLGSMIHPLVSLPESLCNLESIWWLALGGAGLDYLPENFGNLTTVESCFLWGNNLTELPDGFGGMESLNYLTLDGNQLTTLPESFGDLDNLSKLFIEENQLTHFPESFGDLASLDSLWVRVNQITHLPESFGNLADLNLIKMSVNNITELPASFSNLATIDEIALDNNLLESLPEDIGNLTTLEFFGLSSNNLTSIPESITNCTNLAGLFVNNNQIETVPEDIGDLQKLRFLGLDGNNISELPESIGYLSSLGYIGVTFNNLTSLPETFGYLEADTVLVSDNQIVELPSTMFDNYYQFLWVAANELQFGSIEPLIGHVSKEFAYSPQGLIGTDTTIIVIEGQTVNYTIEVSGENNLYFWYKNGTIIAGQNTNTLQILNAGASDEATYQLKVSNTVAGALTLESHNMELVISNCVPWEFATNSLVHTISVPASANPNIGGEPLQDGDWIGVFFLNDESVETCGGASMWNSSGVDVLAYGNNPFVPGKDGFDDGEAFIWKMFRCSDEMEVIAAATYDLEMPNLGFYANGGTSSLTSLSDGYIQNFNMTTGWNGVSSYIVPTNPAVQDIMAPVVNDLILMRNLTQVYWPEEQVNTIGDWDNNSGYAIKFAGDAAFDISGSSFADKNMPVNTGWSYLPVISECDVDATALFGAHTEDIVIVQDLIGTQIYWPEHGIYTLETLVPGKAYKIKTNNGFTMIFPECGEKQQSSHVSMINSLSTPWGEFNMTPSSENVVIFADALKSLETGDIVAAFNQDNMVCGMMEVGNTSLNQSLILFGDDPTTMENDGLAEGEIVSYKLYRTSTNEEFVLNVEYSMTMENSTGHYYSDSFTGITNMTTSITSIDEMNGYDISIYPNPARDVVTIDISAGNGDDVDVSIFNAQGRVVVQKNITRGKSELNVGDLKQGVYFVRINTSDLNKTIKLVIE